MTAVEKHEEMMEYHRAWSNSVKDTFSNAVRESLDVWLKDMFKEERGKDE